MKRPPEMLSSVAAVIAVIAGVRAGIWKMPEAIFALLGVRRDPGQHGRGVGAVGLGRPDRVVAEAVRLLRHLELLVARDAEAPVTGEQSQFHCLRRLADIVPVY